MSDSNRSLRLVVIDADEADHGASVVSMGSSSELLRERGILKSEALAIEAQNGKNAYSDFLLKHSCLPDAPEAAVIGRLLGGRVRAADGSLQPVISDVDRQMLGERRERRRSASRRYDHILRLRAAVDALAQNEDDPAEIIGDGSVFLQHPEIALQLDNALVWLNRFAKEWHDREKEART
jgi:hypothetical protein